MQKQMEILLEQIQYPDHQLFYLSKRLIEKVDALRKTKN